MTIIGNHYKKCIYSYEFDDNYVYVGLTYNIEERKKQHCKRGPVKNHILNTGNLPVFKILTEYILSKDAISKEEEFLNFYKNNGWNTLNIMKTGALGGGKTKWTKEKCQEESIKYNNIKDYKNNSLSYRAAVRNKWLNDICKHMCRVKNSTGYWTKERCIEYSLECKNKKEFEFRYPGGYAACRKNGWIKDISLHMDNRISKEKGYWTKEKCKEEALKYNIRSQFQKNSISSYQTSINNMWLDEICEHMTIKRRLWNKESCLLESLKYKTRGDFVKNSPSAYNKSQKLGWLDEVCLHMIKKDTKLKGH
jgi:predicted GIY-YIG superfamily endonuclease